MCDPGRMSFQGYLKSVWLSLPGCLNANRTPGFSEKFMQRNGDRYLFKEKTNKSKYQYPVKKLVTEFDVTGVAIGMITFNESSET